MSRVVRFVLVAAVGMTAACSGGISDTRRVTTAEDDSFTPCPVGPRLAALEPQEGTYFGVSLDWARDSPAGYVARLGRRPAVYVEFASFPLDRAGIDHLERTAKAVRAEQGMLLVTLEPLKGL
ncbi:MAG: hypothetical protein ABIS21_04465, partial [Acidimicrobiales bacterium]